MLRFLREILLFTTFLKIVVALEMNDTETLLHVEHKIDEIYLRCADDTQLEIISDAIVKSSVSEIRNGNLEYTWNIFARIRVPYDELIQKIVNRFVLDTFCNDCVHTILRFLNHSSNVNWKLIGYRAVLQEISTNENLRDAPSNWWFLQLFLSSEKLTLPTDPELNGLLGEIRPKIIEILDAKPSSETEQQIVTPNFYNSDVYNDYLIDQLSTMDPCYIQKIWNKLNFNKPLETILQFVTALEENNQFNHTVFAIPRLKSELNTRYMDTNECIKRNEQLKEIVAKFPNESILKLLLVPNQTFYIRHADTEEYLCRLSNFRKLIIMCPTKNSTWLTEANYRDYHGLNHFVINTEYENKLTVRKCPLRNEWFFEWNAFGDSVQGTDHWDFEINDIFSNEIQIKNKYTGQYMSVNDKHGVTLSDFDKDKPQKFAWILETESNVDVIYHGCKVRMW